MSDVTGEKVTKSDLAALIIDYLDRPELPEKSVNLFIYLATISLSRVVRIPAMIKRAELEAKSGRLPLPGDWVETVTLTGPNGLLLRPTGLTLDAGSEGGEPRWYHLSSDLELDLIPKPVGAAKFSLIYYQRLFDLKMTGDTNPLLTLSPDAYLYSALYHSASYLGELERAPLWDSARLTAIAEVNRAGKEAAVSGAGLSINWGGG